MAKEIDKLIGHSYDGIQEYDNPLPGWWIWLFYGTIIFSIVYFPYYLLDYGASSTARYTQEMQTAKQMRATALKDGAAQNAASKPASAPAVASKPAKGASTAPGPGNEMASLAGDKAAIAAGKAVFQTYCLGCHGPLGQGLIGPNLTDNFWLHGNTYPDLVKVITDGVPDKGMVPWKTQLPPLKIHQVSAFVLSLKGSNPPNPKAHQGKEYKD